MRMRPGGGLERVAPAGGPTGRHLDRAENARIDASLTWSRRSTRGGISRWRCW
jgi:hypothetical protein